MYADVEVAEKRTAEVRMHTKKVREEMATMNKKVDEVQKLCLETRAVANKLE